ncbi:PREDICTED: trafficking protein particle complex II-specific subunit 120 homolog isoform X2 [Fragaria vesca subsp. vesca]|uniref:trafficking protein particle complex II-specific subunit 120 homolog isoform X2 n=1 Tax=Fragaria vesca subsp. vesca TaxID=101020 RepID=UPI0002C2FB83|nr:PREDICTED: trafficking protein particle complex II-specific subunit 120 homolog isoform X2 [Fragaria vesca subsp. vesca]
MEPDVSIETSSMIRVAVLPIGHVPPVLLRDYHAMLLRHQTIPLSAVSSFYTEHQKSPFAHQPWDSGSLRFKFVLGGAPPSPWEDFQSNRKTLAVIGICHCPSSPDLGSVMDQFDTACRAYPAALVERCFAFSPADSQLEDGSKKGWNLMLFPPADRATQEFHLQTMMQDIAASLLMEFEKWVLKAEPAGTIVKTPLDSQATLNSEEVIKAKKRRLGRAQKTMGDYCMLAGSPVDANLHYSTALELARLTGDFFWYAGALEGSVCALLIDQMGQKDTAVEEEVRYRYSSVILHYKKSFIQENAQRVSPLTFELEATLKLARFLCRRELAKEVVELLTNAADGAKSLIDASDRLVLYVEIARLYGTLGYQRKAAFFSRQVAQLYLQQDNRLAAISAMQVLAMTTKAYRVQSKASVLEDSLSKETGSGLAESGKILHQSVVSLFESQWSTLQMVVLREILLSAVRAGDPLAAWGAAARLLRSYYPLITPAGQNGLASALSNSADRLPSGTRCADPALPFIRLYSFPLHPSQMDIVKRNPAREDWWAGAANTGPFIYTPFSKGEPSNSSKQELIWIVGEPVQILVELANPCGFDLKVDSIYLSVPSGNFDAFPVAVNLPPNSSKVVTLSGIPTSVGPVTIPGCTVHCFGVITEHLFKDVDNLLLGATQGLVLSDPFRCCGSARLKNISVPSISVVPPLPLLVSRVVGGDGAIILHEGEIRDIWISLANAGTVPVEQVHVSLSGKHQDSVLSIASETLKSALPLRPGAEVTIPVTLKAWRIVAADADTAAGRSASKHSKDGNSPTLLIHYAGTVPNTEDPSTDKSVVPPGRRLVVPLQICVLQGLSFVKARLLSMEIPAQVGYNLPTPVHTDYSLTEGAAGTPNKLDQLVKIDPFRGSWGLRFLELELSNPTDVVFEISVSVQLENTDHEQSLSVDQDATEYGYPKTRIDRDCSARVLIPLEHFKLPVLDDSFFVKDNQADGSASGRSTSFSERNTKAELNASIKNLISRIKVRWQSGRNSSGELNIKDAVQAALQTSVMDVLLPDPLTFGFRLSRSGPGPENIDSHEKSNDEVNSSASKGSVMAHEMTPMEVMVRNNTKELIKMSLNVVCRDVAGEDCVECAKATVLCSGVLSGITVEIPPLEEIKHSFSLYFLVPGEYTLIAAAMIEDATDILRARARTTSSDEPIFCHGPPYHVRVVGTA